MDPRQTKARWLGLLGIASALFTMLALRVRAVPVAEWGSNGSAWSEHVGRLSWLTALRANRGQDDPLGFLELLAKQEGGFPAGLYLWGASLEPVFGDTAQAVAWAGLLWLVPLAWGVGAVAAALGRDRTLLPVAAAAVLLVPALPAASLRFYFDLPMTALVWCSAGVLARWPGARGGVGAGLLGGLACVVKWTALPFVLPLWAGLAWALGRTREAAVAAAAMAVSVGGYLAAVGPGNSLLAMAGEAQVADASGVGGLVTGTLVGLLSPQPELLARLIFYPATTVAGVLSPVGAAILLALAPGWWRRGRPGGRLLAAVFVGHAAVLLLLVQPVDERFVLTAAPAAVVAAVLAWSGLRHRTRAGAVIVAAMLVVAADAHLGVPGLGTPAATFQPVRDGGEIASQTVRLRGLGLASSFQGRGWYRRDEVPPARTALREGLWSWVRSCGPSDLQLAVDRPLVHAEGDGQWFAYRAALAGWRGEEHLPGVRDAPCEEPSPPGAVWLRPATVAGNQTPPGCPGDWALVDVVDDPDGGAGVAAWSRGGLTDCDAVRIQADR